MTWNALIQCGLYLVVLIGLGVPLGAYMARVYLGEARLAERIIGPLERLFYRASGVRADEEMTWKRYAAAVLLFNLMGVVVVYGLMRLQDSLPLNPDGLGAVGPEVSFNTAVSFATNTNWQAYGGETTLSYFTQMVGLTVQNFVSAATGMAVLVALVRGFTRKNAQGLGSFWVDLTKSTLYVLLPLSIVLALLLVSQGVVQTWSAHASAHLLDASATSDGTSVTEQLLAVGPRRRRSRSSSSARTAAASSTSTRRTRSRTRRRSPTSSSCSPSSSFRARCASRSARMVKDKRQGIAMFAAMLAMFVPLARPGRRRGAAPETPYSSLGVDPGRERPPGGRQHGGQGGALRDREQRLWATATTAASNGSVNAMHDSFTPLGGLVPMWLMQLGEIVFGGVGSGLYGMLVYAIIAVFIAGLMVGRTPEYLGKKIEAFEMKMASLVILLPSAAVLLGTAIACVVPEGSATLGNPGAHGFSEILYAFSSGSNNNGSAFGGITVSGPFYATAIGLACSSGAIGSSSPSWRSRARSPRRRRCRRPLGTSPPTPRCSSRCSSGTVVLVGALDVHSRAGARARRSSTSALTEAR
jgi:K+-transporting ATPase ATPase A chain